VSLALQEVVNELVGFEIPSDQPLMEAGLDSIGERRSLATVFDTVSQLSRHMQV
jgi:hypothetical protein